MNDNDKRAQITLTVPFDNLPSTIADMMRDVYNKFKSRDFHEMLRTMHSFDKKQHSNNLLDVIDKYRQELFELDLRLQEFGTILTSFKNALEDNVELNVKPESK